MGGGFGGLSEVSWKSWEFEMEGSKSWHCGFDWRI